ncbi:hypothetical protein RB195_007072 [Necator americanus]|uniref:Skp1-related protein n=1 Tax=Necator americanus TaxID=51031 RepID=A0ABR1BZ41_NECAM
MDPLDIAAAEKSSARRNDAEKSVPEKIYKVVTKDMEVCEVSASVISMSKLITTMLEDLNLQDDDAPIPVPNVTSAILKKVVYWCEKHKPVSEKTASMKKNDEELQDPSEIKKWRSEYFKVDHAVLFEIIMAANYLDIPGLLEDSCEVVASMMRGKTAEEIRLIFNIANDLTPEEEEKIRKEGNLPEE